MEKASRRQYVCCAIASSCLSSTPRGMLHMMACGTTGEGTERTPTIYVFFNHKSPRPLLLLPRLLCFLLLPSPSLPSFLPSFLLSPFLLCASAENGFATRKTLRLRGARPCHAGRMNNCKHYSVTCAASYVPRASQTSRNASLVKPLGMSALSTPRVKKCILFGKGKGLALGWLTEGVDKWRGG